MRKLGEGRTDIGAIVTFTGLCRDESGRLSALELEHYPGMAEAEITRIARQAAERWPLTGVTVIHRYGLIKPGIISCWSRRHPPTGRRLSKPHPT